VKTIECGNEADWLAERDKLAVTASEVFTLMTKPLTHYARKKGILPGPEQSERMTWGKRLQGEIARGFAEDTGRKVELAAPFTLFLHEDFPCVGATPDAIETVQERGRGALEIKNTESEWIDDPPVMYQAQLQCQLSVLGFQFGTLAALHRGNKLIWADMTRNDDFIKRFLGKAEEMAWRIATNNPPFEIDASEDTAKALSALYPVDSGSQVALPPEALEWTREIELFKQQTKSAEEQIRLRENQIKHAIGESSIGVLADGSMWSWKKQTRVDPPRLEPRVTEFRVLRRLKG
jgi:predicted phage-related endonuclease